MPSTTNQPALTMDSVSPATHAVAVTPHDTNPIVSGVPCCRGLWVGTAGDLTVVMAGGDTVTYPNASGWMPIVCQIVMDTGTDAEGIVAVW